MWRELLRIIGELSPADVEMGQGVEQEGGGSTSLTSIMEGMEKTMRVFEDMQNQEKWLLELVTHIFPSNEDTTSNELAMSTAIWKDTEILPYYNSHMVSTCLSSELYQCLYINKAQCHIQGQKIANAGTTIQADEQAYDEEPALIPNFSCATKRRKLTHNPEAPILSLGPSDSLTTKALENSTPSLALSMPKGARKGAM